jgi:hypothetical protein
MRGNCCEDRKPPIASKRAVRARTEGGSAVGWTARMGRKGLGVKAPANCRLIGRWRIVEADLRDRAYLNLCGPATLTITAQGADRLRRLWRPASPSTRSASAGPDATKTTKSRAKELPNSSKAAPSRSCSLRKTVRPGSVWGASISGSGLGQPFCCDWRLSVLAAVSPHRPRNGRPSAVTVSFGSLTGSESAGRPENGKG